MPYNCEDCVADCHRVGKKIASVGHCRKYTTEAPESPAPSGQAEFALLGACKRLLEAWDKKENECHEEADETAKISASRELRGRGTAYGICREELRQAVEGL